MSDPVAPSNAIGVLSPPPSASLASVATAMRPAPSSARMPDQKARRRAQAHAGGKGGLQRGSSNHTQSPSILLQQCTQDVEKRTRSKSRNNRAQWCDDSIGHQSAQQPLQPSPDQPRASKLQMQQVDVADRLQDDNQNSMLHSFASAFLNILARAGAGVAAGQQLSPPPPKSVRPAQSSTAASRSKQHVHGTGDSSSSSASTVAVRKSASRSRYALGSVDSSDEEEAEEEDGSSGNETDLQAADDDFVPQSSPSPTLPQARPFSSNNDSSSLSMSEEEQRVAPQPRASPRPSSSTATVPCSFHPFGCESLVRSTSDAHYASSYEHHLSLLQARLSVLASQKTQLAQEAEAHQRREARWQAKQQRLRERIANRDEQILLLRQRARRHKDAHRAAQSLQLHNVQELISSFLGSGVPINAKPLLLQQQKEIMSLKAELAHREQLLQKMAQFIPGYAQQQSAGATAAALDSPDPAVVPTEPRRAGKRKQKQQLAAAPTEEPGSVSATSVVEPPAEGFPATVEDAAAAGDADAAFAGLDAPPIDLGVPAFLSLSSAAAKVGTPVSPAFKPTPQYVKIVPTSTSLQQSQSAKAKSMLRSVPSSAASHHALPARSPVDQVAHHYTVPHSSLKPLTQMMTKVNLQNVLSLLPANNSSAAAAQQQQKQQQAAQRRPKYKPDMSARHQRDRAQIQAAEAFVIGLLSTEQQFSASKQQQAQQQQPQSLFASANLHKFCPPMWIKGTQEGK